MIAAADGMWPPRPIAGARDGEASAVEMAVTLIGRLLDLTGSSAEHLAAGDHADAMALLEERDQLFGELGAALGRIGAGTGTGQLDADDLQRLAAAANELGRMEAEVAERLAALREEAERELKSIGPPDGEPPPDVDRRLDIVG